jgi:hypothetical protein
MSEETLVTSEAATTTEGEAVESAVSDTASANQQSSVDDTQAEVDAQGEVTEESSEEAKPDGAPEQYEFELADLKVDPDSIDAFKEVARELDLSQDKAQALLSKMVPAMQTRQQALLSQARDNWATASKGDQEFGGDKLNENLAVAKKAMDAFGTPELTKLLNESGLGNHPEVIRVFFRAGKAISEDGFVRGQGSSDATSDPAKRLFPNQA